MNAVKRIARSARSFAEVGRIGGHVLWEKLVGVRLTRSTDVPRAVDDITPAWLTKVLCPEIPAAAVTAVEMTGSSDGTTTRRAITVHYNEAARGAGLSDRFFAKTTPGLRTRLICGPPGGLANEVGFYGTIRPLLDIEAPRAAYARYDPRSYRSCILMDDLVNEGVNFCSPSVHIDRVAAEEMVMLLAKVHAQFWDDPRLHGAFGWLTTAAGFQARLNAITEYEKRSYIGADRAADVICASVMRDLHRMWPIFLRSLELNNRGVLTLQHHDVHIGNWYRTASDRMGLCDWQCTVKGRWAGDLAYVLASALTIEDRRAWERDLIRLYLESISARGIVAPSFDDALLEFRQQLFHPFFFWIFTIGAGPLEPDMQRDEVSLKNIERMAAAIDDHDALSAVANAK